MALMHVEFFSKVLALTNSMDIIMPQYDTRDEYPVLWLLHGGGGTQSDWHRFTNIERYVENTGITVIMPYAWMSRYCNMTYGGEYYDFLTTELLEICRNFFPKISAKRELNYIAGLSLGGSGALSLGIRNPDKYGAIGVLSASSIIPLEYLRTVEGGPASPGGTGKKSVNMINFGVEDTGDLVGTEHDVLMYARQNVENKVPLPKIFHAVGTEDHAYPVGLGLKEFFESFPGNPYQYEFHTEPGQHNWDFWDKWIKEFVNMIALQNKEVR